MSNGLVGHKIDRRGDALLHTVDKVLTQPAVTVEKEQRCCHREESETTGMRAERHPETLGNG